MSECGYSHDCRHDGISLQFGHSLFGTTPMDNFADTSECFTFDSVSRKFTYDANFGDCGQEISRVG